jgi:hypothetical protein
MKTLKFGALAFLFMGLAGCSGEIAWKTDSTSGFYTMEIPEHFEQMDGLNEEATSSFGYINENTNPYEEHYLIVLMETKEEIASYDLGFEFDAMSYSELAVQSLEGGLDQYEVLTKNPKVETVNGMDCVKNEMKGALGDVKVFYKLGVFEGENAFYQVLTWTIEDQKDQFGPHMDKIISSFKEA